LVGNWEIEICPLNHFHNSTADSAFPASVLLVHDDVPAGNLERNSVSQQDDSRLITKLLHYGNSVTEQCRTVALL
jgi:hypothetical protein